jgi:outer membrane lipoprotein-sorting protein
MVSIRSGLARAGEGLTRREAPPVAGARWGGPLLLLLLLGLGWGPASAAAPDGEPAWLDRWFAAQTNLHTWSADFVQTRSLKALVNPLVSTGRVWVAVPDRFRWELGQPAQTVAVRQPDRLWVIYPRLKRAERYPLGAHQQGPWSEATALLEAGFPRSRAELTARFRAQSGSSTNELLQLTLQPRSASARRMLSEIRVWLRPPEFGLAGNEVTFTDGSSLRFEYSNVQINPRLPEGCFEATLEPGTVVVDPLKP